MAVTTEKSTQLNNVDAKPPVMNHASQSHGRLRVMAFEFTQGAAAGDANSLMNLVQLPAGKLRCYFSNSWLANSAFGAARTLDVGWTAYVDPDGVAVAASVDGFDADIDVSGAAAAALGSDIAAANGKMVDFDSRDGVLIQAKVIAGTIPAAATLKGYIVYAQD
jgi:hypothetical protein